MALLDLSKEQLLLPASDPAGTGMLLYLSHQFSR